MKKPQLFAALSIAALLAACSGRQAARRDTVWPGGSWPRSAPEEQGMDSARLAGLFRGIAEEELPIDSVTVIRNGHLVADAHVHPFAPDRKHIIHSCTKSIVSTLIGIAIDQEKLSGVDQKVLEIFPDRAAVVMEEEKRVLTLEHFLTMSHGLRTRDSYLYRWEGLARMGRSVDWVAHVLALPMEADPGTRFDYSNCGSFLLSAVVQEAVGTTSLAYAQEHLFGPLGITDVRWPANPQGISIGWGEIWLRPHDMARVGYLFLNGGTWDGKRIVSERWVRQATRSRIEAETLAPQYGYQWWVDQDEGLFMALGYGGQYIAVSPRSRLVAVFTSALPETDFFVPRRLILDGMVAAVASDRPLDENPQGREELAGWIRRLTDPTPEPVPPLPDTAARVHGRRIESDAFAAAIRAMVLEFGEDDGTLRMIFEEEEAVFPFGLDGVARTTAEETPAWFTAPVAATGAWLDEDRFRIRLQPLGYSYRQSMEFAFSENAEVTVRFINDTTGFAEDVDAEIVDACACCDTIVL